MTITAQDLPEILERHLKWRRSEEGGCRANLRGADLRRADLRRADLRGADLRRANLRRADLRGAWLSSAVHAFASVSFFGHGECGRTLTAIRRNEGDAPILQCGCFWGNQTELVNLASYDMDGIGFFGSRTMEETTTMLGVDAAIIVAAINALPALLAVAEALRNIERNYTQLIESGDVGNYDPQSVPAIAQARTALAKLYEVKHG